MPTKEIPAANIQNMPTRGRYVSWANVMLKVEHRIHARNNPSHGNKFQSDYQHDHPNAQIKYLPGAWARKHR